MARDPSTIAKRWSQNLGASQEKIREGVQAVTQSPTARAAAADVKYLAGVQRGVSKWKSRLNAVTLSEWQTAMVEKGLPRVAQGAMAAEGKVSNFMTQFLPYVDTAAATVRAMPNLTLEDAVNRAAAMIRANAKFQYRK